MALCFISHMNRIAMSVAGDQKVMSQFGFSPTRMGWIYSSFLIVYTICMIPGGFFIDRVGSRRALIFMGLGSAFFGALTGFAGMLVLAPFQIWIALLLIRGLMGFCTTPLHPGCARAVSDYIPLPGRSWANGLVTGAAILGVSLSHRVVGSLIDRFDWPSTFVILAGVTVLVTFLWYLQTCSRHGPQKSPAAGEPVVAPSGEKWTSLLRNRNLILLTLSYAAVGYFQYLFFYWMHFYFDEVLHLGKEASRVYTTIPPLAMAITMPLGGWLSDWLQRKRGYWFGRAMVPMIGMLAGAAFLGLGVLAKDPRWIVACFSLALGAVGAAEGPFWATVVEVGGKRGGTAAAIFNTGGNAGGLIAPVLTPWISEHFGWPVGIALGGVICLAGGALWFFIKPNAPNDQESPAPRI